MPPAIESVSTVWKKIIKDSLARLFNWNGRVVKNRPTKVAFGKNVYGVWCLVCFLKYCTVIISILIYNFKSLDAFHGLHSPSPILEAPFVKATKNWLRHSPARFASQYERGQLEYQEETDEEF